MKKIFKRTSLLLATALIGVTATVQAQKSPQDMDRFVDALMRRMTCLLYTSPSPRDTR